MGSETGTKYAVSSADALASSRALVQPIGGEGGPGPGPMDVRGVLGIAHEVDDQPFGLGDVRGGIAAAERGQTARSAYSSR